MLEGRVDPALPSPQHMEGFHSPDRFVQRSPWVTGMGRCWDSCPGAVGLVGWSLDSVTSPRGVTVSVGRHGAQANDHWGLELLLEPPRHSTDRRARGTLGLTAGNSNPRGVRVSGQEGKEGMGGRGGMWGRGLSRAVSSCREAAGRLGVGTGCC